VIDVIVNQRLFCLTNGLLDGMELLRQVDARPTLFDHVDDAPQVSRGSPQPLDDLRVALMKDGTLHGTICERGILF